MELIEIYKLPDGCYELYVGYINTQKSFKSDVKMYITLDNKLVLHTDKGRCQIEDCPNKEDEYDEDEVCRCTGVDLMMISSQSIKNIVQIYRMLRRFEEYTSQGLNADYYSPDFEFILNNEKDLQFLVERDINIFVDEFFPFDLGSNVNVNNSFRKKLRTRILNYLDPYFYMDISKIIGQYYCTDQEIN